MEWSTCSVWIHLFLQLYRREHGAEATSGDGLQWEGCERRTRPVSGHWRQGGRLHRSGGPGSHGRGKSTPVVCMKAALRSRIQRLDSASRLWLAAPQTCWHYVCCALQESLNLTSRSAAPRGSGFLSAMVVLMPPSLLSERTWWGWCLAEWSESQGETNFYLSWTKIAGEY